MAISRKNSLRCSFCRKSRYFVHLVSAAGLCVMLSCSGERDRSTEIAIPAPATPASPIAVAAPGEALLVFPGPQDELLHLQRRAVPALDVPEDRGKLALEELFRGPEPPLLPLVTVPVKVRQVFLTAEGTAWVDLSSEILAMHGGSLQEILTVYAIVDTVALNLKEARKVGILVDGREVDSLMGHLAIDRPLQPDFRYIEGHARAPEVPPPQEGQKETPEGQKETPPEPPEGEAEGTKTGEPPESGDL